MRRLSRTGVRPLRLDRRRAIALHWRKQLLDGTFRTRGKAAARRAVERLGYVQIDTISVIERSHHLVLFARCPDYQTRYLDELLWPDRKVFEYWAHAASYIPMKDYRYYLPRIRRPPKPGSWFEKWSIGNRAVIRKVLRRIEREGPLSAADFPDDPGRKRGPWWDWKPEKAALEVLFWRGELMIRERRKFQRVYDLAERVLPDGLDLTLPGESEEKEFFIRRCLGSLGPATVQDINRYIDAAGRLDERLAEMVRGGEVAEVAVEGSDRPHYLLARDRRLIEDGLPDPAPGVIFLSPFDNSVILRDRTRRLFDIPYNLECYAPPAKRKFGYFCLPILWQNDLVGRIDLKADRQAERFLVKGLHLEKNGLDSRSFASSLALALKRYAQFHGCPEIRFSKPVDGKLGRAIGRYL